MIKSKKKMLMIIGAFILVLALFTTTYAFFNYTRVGGTNTLIVGNIYMNHTQGTAINLLNEFPVKVEDARSRNDNTVTVEVTGYNESDRDIFYKLLLSHGDDIEGRNRIDDKYLRFDLVELLDNNEEKYIIYNENFETINNTLLLRDKVDAGTSSSSEITKTYRLRMWIDYDILVSDTNEDADYTTTEFNNLFASVKVTAKGQTENVYYYGAFDDAIDDINDESFESNANRSTAKVGVYIDQDDNSTNLVLYDDAETNRDNTISNSVNINLYGNTLNLKKAASGTTTGLRFTDDFIIENGEIDVEDAPNSSHYYGIASYGSRGVINNINLPYVSYNVFNYWGAYEGGDLFVKNTTARSVEIDSYVNSNSDIVNSNISGNINIYSSSTMKIDDSDIDNGDDTEDLIYISDLNSKLVVNNSTLFADSPGCYMSSDGRYQYSSIAIQNGGILIFNSGYVFGTHSAVQTNIGSKTYVYGGTFESTDHGGFYFHHGSTGIAYIENANINGIVYPSRGMYRPNGTATPSYTVDGKVYNLEENKTAFYSGGDQEINGQVIYLVNCKISALSNQVTVMKSSIASQTIYMSGCTFSNTNSSQYLRMDNLNGMKMYFGKNNNFGNISNVLKDGLKPFATVKELGAIVETNADYKNAVRPTN